MTRHTKRKRIKIMQRQLSYALNQYILRADTRYEMGDYEAADQDYSSSLTNYSQYYSDNSHKAWIYYWRGICRMELGRMSDAISDFDNAISYNYDNPGYVYWNRGACHFNLGSLKECEEDYAKAIDRISDTKDLSRLYKDRGDVWAEQYKYEKAFGYYDKAIYYNPENYNAFWQRGYYRNLNYESEEALKDYDLAINAITKSSPASMNADLASLYRNKALIYRSKDNLPAALEWIDKAILANPNSSKGFQTRGDIYWDMKKYDKSKSAYDAAINLQTDKKSKAEIYLNRSMKFWNILDYTAAMKDLNMAVELNPAYGMLYWHRAMLYGYKKNYAQAIKECNTALELYRKDSSSTASLFFLRAGFYEGMGNNEKALIDYRSYVDYYPNNLRAYYNLGRFFKLKIKNNDLANANLVKAEDLAITQKDTTMFCYINIIRGEKEVAIRTMLQRLETTKTNKGYDPDELHNMTCIYALTGNTAKSFEYLDKSLAAGYTSYLHLVNDRDLVSLMNLPQWKSILGKHKVPGVK
jgi:tetratricopeptide (TPR) repeat protein